mmetsp:Transcript_80836/g.142577  ORF Transcript_80836/g.142577 Transcript_80836/m.142577 type:complete len:537 (+) Transcript_80836:34-1644(+)
MALAVASALHLLLLLFCHVQLAMAFNFDPVAEANQLLILCVMIVALVLAWQFRDRIIMALTGDDRIHLDFNSVVWSFFTCCGICDGEWTRCVTRYCCMCCEDIRGHNLLRMGGQQMGVVPTAVQIVNIVVGDMPKYRRGDFYLSVETGSNPPQVTSVVENADPKAVNFSDTMLIKIRRSLVEENVRFVVKELNTLGSGEICECYISPMKLLKWHDSGKGPVRLKMDPCNRRESFTFPSWILLEVAEHKEPGKEADFDVLVTSADGKTRHRVPKDFKSQYSLLDSNGMTAQEPDEDQVGKIDWTKRTKRVCLGQVITILLLASVTFITTRIYCFSCEENYKEIAVFENFNVTFPVAKDKAAFYVERCSLGGNVIVKLSQSTWEESKRAAQKVQNGEATAPNAEFPAALNQFAATTTPPSGSNVDPKCIVTEEQVLQVCSNQPVGAHVAGLDINLVVATLTIPCLEQSCKLNSLLEHFDVVHVAFVLGMVVFYIILLCGFNARIKGLEAALAASNEDAENKYDKMMAGAGCSRIMQCS